MLEYGWIKLSRKITKWRWYKDGNTFRLFIHLILTANHESHDFETITINRGQRIASRKTLSEETGLSEQEVKTAIKHLTATKELTSKSTRKYTIFTINNYDNYQISDIISLTNDQPTANQQLTNDQPIDNQQLTNDQPQCKKDKKDKKDNNIFIGDAPHPPKKKKSFAKPTVDEVREYCDSRSNSVDPEYFVNYYEANGWHVGKNPMKDWKAAVRTWEAREKSETKKQDVVRSDNAEAYKSFIYNIDE